LLLMNEFQVKVIMPPCHQKGGPSCW
jgi:hypothetical protein